MSEKEGIVLMILIVIMVSFSMFLGLYIVRVESELYKGKPPIIMIGG